LCVFEDELIRRMLQRAEMEGRADDNEETIQERLRVYAEQTIPVLEYYQESALVSTIDGIGTPEEVFGRLKDCVNERYSR
jgi:adenylate kinase